jgi:iron complex transport system substrate-binding protein
MIETPSDMLVSKKIRTFATFLAMLCIHALATADTDVPQARELDYAKNFTIEEYADYKLLTVSNAYRNSKSVHRYALIPHSATLPDELPRDAVVIRTPVQRVVIMETVYAGYLDALGQLDQICGAASASYINHPKVIQGVKSGDIQSIQSGQKLNIERLLLLQPDLILTTSLGEGQIDVSPQLQRAGLPVVLTADYMEHHPLARAEWLKFIAAFFESEDRSNEIFNTIKAQYTRLVDKTKGIDERPSVFCGAPYSGSWHVPGGDSFIARAIHDAGAHYLWADDPSRGSLPLDTERVFLRAAEADYWIHPNHYHSLSELFNADPRFAKFGAAQISQVFNNTRQVSKNGGNNIWERGIVHPEEVLADLIKIFHPDLLPEHELVYYENLQ